MYLIEVDVVGTQSLQAGFDRLHDVQARQPDVVRALPHPSPYLGGDDDVLAPTGERAAQDLLRVARRVDIGRVEEVDASIERPVNQRVRCGLIERSYSLPLRSERHRAQTQL